MYNCTKSGQLIINHHPHFILNIIHFKNTRATQLLCATVKLYVISGRVMEHIIY